jgi:leader peptidase (prepilin peptidase)/N-methyltransferase
VTAAVIFAGVMGLVVGSFLNVVIHRLPRGESLMGRSRCPGCGTQIAAYDNVPLLSWLLLRGRCRHCGARISARYPLVEAATALLFISIVLAKDGGEIWIGLAFVTLLVPVTLIDLDLQIIPNRLLAPGAVVGLALVAALQPDDLVEHLIAAGAAGGFLLLAVLVHPRGMGEGDVKLAGVMGIYLGRAVGPAMLVALVAGTVVGLVVIARKGVKEGRKTRVPFGPFLALGGYVGLLVGDQIVDWYLDNFA